MKNANTNVSSIQFITNVIYYWSLETVADFLENKLPHLDYDIDTSWLTERKSVLEILVFDYAHHNSKDRSLMGLLLKHGANPLKRRRCGGTIIQGILRIKDPALIIQFLEYVEDINMIHGNCTALHIAVKRKLKDVVEYIVGRNADINKKSYNGCTPLHESVKTKSVDITKILLENGADIDVKNETGETPLHLAFKYNNPDQVRTLIINGADVNATDAVERTPLHFMCSKKSFNFELYELLLEKCDVNAKDVDGATPLHYLMRSLPVDSSISKKKKLINLFLKYGGNLHESYRFFGTVVHAAAFLNHTVPFLTFLIEKGADRAFADIGRVTFMRCIQLRNGEDKVEEVLKFLFARECASKFQFTENLLTFIESDEKFIELQKSCKKELSILKYKKLIVNDTLSLFAVLSTNERDLANLYRQYPLRTNEIADFETERFPIYGNDLVRNHKKAVAILDAEILICDFLTETSNNVLDQYSIYEIVKFIPTQAILKVPSKLL
ncbi:poly [ADP-ribose] polymerase tankyrase-like [Coccinella septempunctata]|uniref:poly [ADP-ribose] polymerase tankyrase-like n=1 Tax=Coccinella septempunctata TaxID=41139 RepID=UPI001D0666A6|nr:poly [ADP-ribose] polymerase tankyrase-like [Coccinella septempunctata]